MKQKFLHYYMDIAQRTAQMSSAIRLQVGAILVRDHQIIGTGYNGMPAGWDNTCEDHIYADDGFHITLTTKPQVLHAESNCLMKVARSTESSLGSTMFCTHAPCLECSKLIYQSGVKDVYYRTQYRSSQGLEFLAACDVPTIQI